MVELLLFMSVPLSNICLRTKKLSNRLELYPTSVFILPIFLSSSINILEQFGPISHNHSLGSSSILFITHQDTEYGINTPLNTTVSKSNTTLIVLGKASS